VRLVAPAALVVPEAPVVAVAPVVPAPPVAPALAPEPVLSEAALEPPLEQAAAESTTASATRTRTRDLDCTVHLTKRAARFYTLGTRSMGLFNSELAARPVGTNLSRGTCDFV
jgi:hypothetical protein